MTLKEQIIDLQLQLQTSVNDWNTLNTKYCDLKELYDELCNEYNTLLNKEHTPKNPKYKIGSLVYTRDSFGIISSCTDSGMYSINTLRGYGFPVKSEEITLHASNLAIGDNIRVKSTDPTYIPSKIIEFKHGNYLDKLRYENIEVIIETESENRFSHNITQIEAYPFKFYYSNLVRYSKYDYIYFRIIGTPTISEPYYTIESAHDSNNITFYKVDESELTLIT